MRALPLLLSFCLTRVACWDPSHGNCSLTARPPAKARYLKFCQDFNSMPPGACCIPGHDLENQVQFENLIEGLGPGCKNPMMYPEVRFFYCLGCDPNQPMYTDPVANQIRVCKSFLDKLWRDPAFDECGVMQSNACPTSWVNENMDPYMCGDDLILPKQTFSSVVGFINAFKPPGLDDFDFVAVDDSAEGHLPCWNAKVYSNSAAALGRGSVAVALVFATIGFVALQAQLS